MVDTESALLDVAVVGGGPAGVSACLELSRSRDLRIGLFESEEELGGIPRSCHLVFGMRDLKWFYTGPAYARKLGHLIQRTPVEVHSNATVLEVLPGGKGECHRVKVVSTEGLKTYDCRSVILATGCCESPLASRFITAARPAGILTTWQLQQMVYFHHLKPGQRAVIIGSEQAALSTAMTLRRAGVGIAAMVEEDPELQTSLLMTRALSFYFGFPIYKGTRINAIRGIRRVEGVEIVETGDGRETQIDCDLVIITGKFRPISELIDDTIIARDPASLGPVVDVHLMTSVSGIFAAGNILRGGDMHDLCAIEGRFAAKSCLAWMGSLEHREGDECVSLCAKPPVRYVVPQRIPRGKRRIEACGWSSPGVSVQIEHTLRNPSLEAWSADQRVWGRTYSKLIGHHRVCIPLNEFDWRRVDPDRDVEIRISAPNA